MSDSLVKGAESEGAEETEDTSSEDIPSDDQETPEGDIEEPPVSSEDQEPEEKEKGEMDARLEANQTHRVALLGSAASTGRYITAKAEYGKRKTDMGQVA